MWLYPRSKPPDRTAIIGVSPGPSTWWTIGAGAALTALALVITVPTWRGPCLLSPDSITYLQGGRALISGEAAPWHTAVVGPGLQFVIAAYSLIDPEAWRLFPVFNGFCMVLATLLTWFLARRSLSRVLAWFTAALVATSPILFEETLFLRSEPLFLVLLLTSLLITETLAATPGAERGRWRFVVLGLVVGLTIAMRAMGALLLPAILWRLSARRLTPSAGHAEGARPEGESMVAHSGFSPHERRRRFRHVCNLLILCAVAVAPSVAWKWHVGSSAVGRGYAHTLTSPRPIEPAASSVGQLWKQRVTKYGPLRLRQVKGMFAPPRVGWRVMQPPWDSPSTWLIGGGVIAILMARVILLRSVGDSYAIASLAFLAIWPWNEDGRLVAPLLPIILISTFSAAAAIGRRLPGIAGSGAVLSGAVALLALQIMDVSIAQRRLIGRQQKTAQVHRVARQFAGWQQASAERGTQWVARLSDGDNAKVVLGLASYLSRQPVVFHDLHAHRTEPPPLPAGTQYVVAPTDLPSRWLGDLKREPVARLDRFRVYLPTVAGSSTALGRLVAQSEDLSP